MLNVDSGLNWLGSSLLINQLKQDLSNPETGWKVLILKYQIPYKKLTLLMMEGECLKDPDPV